MHRNYYMKDVFQFVVMPPIIALFDASSKNCYKYYETYYFRFIIRLL